MAISAPGLVGRPDDSGVLVPGEAGLRYVGEATYVGHHEEQEPLARSPGRSTSAPSGTMSAPLAPHRPPYRAACGAHSRRDAG